MPRGSLLRTLGLTATAAALTLAPALQPVASATDQQLVNAGFEQFDAATGAPTGWGIWRARGTGTGALSAEGAGPDGSRALALSGDSTDDRIAVTQRIAYPTPGRSRYLTISFDEKAENVQMASSAWQAGVRVQFLDAANQATAPLTRVGVTAGSHPWRR